MHPTQHQAHAELIRFHHDDILVKTLVKLMEVLLVVACSACRLVLVFALLQTQLTGCSLNSSPLLLCFSSATMLADSRYKCKFKPSQGRLGCLLTKTP
jgi:hypothetical protein